MGCSINSIAGPSGDKNKHAIPFVQADLPVRDDLPLAHKAKGI